LYEDLANADAKSAEHNAKRIKRMTHRAHEKKWMIYPENRHKGAWDLSITLLLLISSVMIPLQIAFANTGRQEGLSNF
jgi:hypothetical protein